MCETFKSVENFIPSEIIDVFGPYGTAILPKLVHDFKNSGKEDQERISQRHLKNYVLHTSVKIGGASISIM
jgi:hypothetical protein